jgi:hypothetical protein
VPALSGIPAGPFLSGYNLSAEPRATALFHYLEASRLAYADRNAYVGDPRYVSVPLSGLLNPAFAATRRCLIGNTALVSPVAPGDPNPPYPSCQRQSAPQAAASSEGLHTNNIVTTDKWGDIVAYTNTINFFGGSGETVPGYGFLLNNEMTDFDFAPSSPGAYDPNQHRRGRRIDHHHDHPADHPEPRRFRHVAARGARGSAGEPDQLGHLAGRTRLLQQRAGAAADQPVRREVHRGDRAGAPP